jgi:cell division protein FtsL
VAPSELRIYSMWEFIVGLVLLTLMVLSIINLIIITTKRRILLDKLKKVGS